MFLCVLSVWPPPCDTGCLAKLDCPCVVSSMWLHACDCPDVMHHSQCPVRLHREKHHGLNIVSNSTTFYHLWLVLSCPSTAVCSACLTLCCSLVGHQQAVDISFSAAKHDSSELLASHLYMHLSFHEVCVLFVTVQFLCMAPKVAQCICTARSVHVHRSEMLHTCSSPYEARGAQHRCMPAGEPTQELSGVYTAVPAMAWWHTAVKMAKWQFSRSPCCRTAATAEPTRLLQVRFF